MLRGTTCSRDEFAGALAPSVAHEFAAVAELPALDLTKTIKSKLLSQQGAQKFNRVMLRFRHVTTAMFSIGECLVFVVFANPREIGPWLAPIVVLLLIPGVLAMTAPIRFELALLVTKSYDFWFFTTVNTVTMVTVGISLHDFRVVVLPIAWVLNQHCILIDAQIRDLRHMVTATVVTTLFYMMFLLATMLRLTDALGDAVLFEYSKKRRTMTTHDLLINSVGTVTVFFARMGYRKWKEV